MIFNSTDESHDGTLKQNYASPESIDLRRSATKNLRLLIPGFIRILKLDAGRESATKFRGTSNEYRYLRTWRTFSALNSILATVFATGPRDGRSESFSKGQVSLPRFPGKWKGSRIRGITREASISREVDQRVQNAIGEGEDEGSIGSRLPGELSIQTSMTNFLWLTRQKCSVEAAGFVTRIRRGERERKIFHRVGQRWKRNDRSVSRSDD